MSKDRKRRPRQSDEDPQEPQAEGGAGGHGMASLLRHLRVWEKHRALDNEVKVEQVRKTRDKPR